VSYLDNRALEGRLILLNITGKPDSAEGMPKVQVAVLEHPAGRTEERAEGGRKDA